VKLDKYHLLTGIAVLVSLLVTAASFFTAYRFTKELLLHESVIDAINYIEVTAAAAGSKKNSKELFNVLRRAPYIESVKEGPPAEKDEFTLTKRLLFPDGPLTVTVKLNRREIESKASKTAVKVGAFMAVVTSGLLALFLFAIHRLYLVPLNRIRKEVGKIQMGDLKKLPEEGEDEFGRIRESINKMIDSIRERDERAEIISSFIQLLTVGKGFNGEFVELMQKVLKLTEADGIVIGVQKRNSDAIEIRVITRYGERVFEKNSSELDGIEPYILALGREIETTKSKILSKGEKALGMKYIFGMPLKAMSDNTAGYVIVYKTKEEPISEENRRFIKSIAKSIAAAVTIKWLIEELEEKLRKEKELKEKILKSFVRGIEIRDSYTRGHSERVAFYSREIARAMGLREEAESIYIAGLLHDIGKIGIPDSILLKPEKLTPEEYEIIKLHPILSYELVKNLDFIKESLDGIKYHHERWDGSGYPDNLQREQIPLSARIIAVADSFDAMTSARIYRKGMNKRAAVEELIKGKGKLYDPEVVDNAVHILLHKTPPPPDDDYLSDDLIKEIEERRLDYYLRDHLTGVFNRNALELAFNQAKERFKKFSAFVLDVEKLREINIEKGWREGDRILKEIVNHIKRSFPEAITVRYSGDNFVVFLPGSFREKLKKQVEKIERELNVKLKLEELNNFKDVEELKVILTELEFSSRPAAQM